MRALVHALTAASVLFIGLQARSAEPFTLTSTSFKDGGVLPLKYAGKFPNSENCVGQNISPNLAWSNPPAGVKSYAIIVLDPEGAQGLGVVHWIAYGIHSETTQFAEGEVSQESPKFVAGKSSREIGYYVGPCAPPGGIHHYSFTVIATDLPPDALPAGLTRDELLAKLKGHAKAAAGLVAFYQHP